LQQFAGERFVNEIATDNRDAEIEARDWLSRVESIGVVGSGVIGSGVAADLALHGFQVVLVGHSPGQLERVPAMLAETARFAPMLRPGSNVTGPDRLRAAVCVSTDPADLAGCGLVVENVTERLEVKSEVHRTLDSILPPEAVVAVNTSSIPVALLAAGTRRPERMIGVHFMNPPYLTAAVEVMRAEATSDETLARVRVLLRRLGKKAIVVGDFPGFVSNRISHLFFNEAARLVADQGVDPSVIDQVFRDCFGHRMGPLETADLIGLDTVVDTLDALRAVSGDARFACCELLRSMVTAGRLGRKSKAGFYTYS
jgi:3-hydroxybutyryl-CoA dehydrogenase